MISARALSVALACLLLVGLGAAGGVWLGARHYRPRRPAGSRAAHGARRSSGGGAVPSARGRGAGLGSGWAEEERRPTDQGPRAAGRASAADRV